jgi:hypothetical protein
MCLKNCLIYNFGWNEKNISVENKINNMLTRVCFPVLYACWTICVLFACFVSVCFVGLLNWSMAMASPVLLLVRSYFFSLYILAYRTLVIQQDSCKKGIKRHVVHQQLITTGIYNPNSPTKHMKRDIKY